MSRFVQVSHEEWIAAPAATVRSQFADLQIQLKPGTNVLVFNAMAATIVEEGLTDETFIRERFTEYDEFREHIKQFAPEKVAAQIGVLPSTVKKHLEHVYAKLGVHTRTAAAAVARSVASGP